MRIFCVNESNDIFTCIFQQSRYALDFFKMYEIPFWKMENVALSKSKNHWYLSDEARDVIVVYMPNTNTRARIDARKSYTIKWYNPRTGGSLKNGSLKSLRRGKSRSLGLPPGKSSKDDWVVLLRSKVKRKRSKA